MQSTRPRARVRLVVPLLALSAASGCGERDRLPAPTIALSAADVMAANKAKPVPSADVLTEAGAARHAVALEVWGETVSRAWGRICRSLAGQGVKIECGGK